MALKVGKFDSVDDFEASLKGGNSFIRYIGDEPLVVRFLTEPDSWIKYSSHYDGANKMSFPCDDEMCSGCNEGMDSTWRYLTNALLVEESRVVPLQIPVTLATILSRRYKKYSTIRDRDYSLEKDGSGMQTRYDATPEAPSRLKLSQYEPLDLLQVLQESMDEYNIMSGIANGTSTGKKAAGTLADDDDEDEKPARKGGATRRTAGGRVAGGPGKKRPGVKAAPEPEEEPEEEEVSPARKARATSRTKAAAAKKAPEPEPDDEEEEVESAGDLMKLGLRGLKSILKEEFGWAPSDYKGMDVDELAENIVELRAEGADDDAEPDDETGVDDEDDEPEEDEDGDEEEDGEEEDGDYLTEDELQEMSVAELKAMCKEYGITVKRAMGKDDMIAALLDSEEEEVDENEPPF